MRRRQRLQTERPRGRAERGPRVEGARPGSELASAPQFPPQQHAAPCVTGRARLGEAEPTEEGLSKPAEGDRGGRNKEGLQQRGGGPP